MKRAIGLKQLHSMQAFGIVPAFEERIRIEPLRVRLQPNVPFPHKHDFYQLVIVRTGQGSHEIDFQKYPAGPGSIFLMKPVQVHSWSFSPASSGYVIEFGTGFLTDLFLGNGLASKRISQLPELVNVPPLQRDFVYEICERMEAEFENRKPGFDGMLNSLLSVLLVDLFRWSSMKASVRTKSRSVVESFLELVEENFREQHGVQFYADALGLSPKVLTMRIRRAMGDSPRDFILGRCFLESKRLLAYSDLPIGEVGREIGFEDQNYFARFFKAQMGMTPKEFRHNIWKTQEN
ncbi:MAG: helix-turn-helix domain-containing protein [Bdellovibrionaceae bacterium]|nr:helix-turn-helix domain-containing protein [Pseudobdellovibrionaceae bacterium]